MLHNKCSPKIIFILGMVALLILTGEINYLAQRFNRRIDVTQNKQHTLNTQTLKLIKTLHQDVEITVLYVGLPPKYLEDILRQYQQHSNGKITTQIIDPIVQIGYAARFGNVIKSKEHKVIVQSKNERKDIDFTDGPLEEEALTNAIVRIIRKPRVAYFLTGHNESSITDDTDTGLTTLVKYLWENNIESKSVMLEIADGIPQDCDILIIPGVKDTLSKKEDNIINTYLNNGGDALFLIENIIVTTEDKPLTPEQKHKNPSLNSILKNWGLHVKTDVVVDLKSHASGDVGSPATRNYMAHRAIVKNLDYTFYVRPRSISITKDRRQTVHLAPIVLTASKNESWGETNRTLKIKFDKGIDRPGPVPIAFAVWEQKAAAPQRSPEIKEAAPTDTRIMVFTDVDFLTNAYINHYSNAEMGLNIINWISELDYQPLLTKKEIKIPRLDLTSQQKSIITAILILMPILIGLGGLAYHFKLLSPRGK